jgi:hypothetical protein
MLDIVRKGKRISFGKQIVIKEDAKIIKEGEVKHLVFDAETKQLFLIMQNDFLIVCKRDNYSQIEVYPKYVFIPIPDQGETILLYYKLLNIPIYTKNTILDRFDLFGYTFVDDKNGEATISD